MDTENNIPAVTEGSYLVPEENLRDLEVKLQKLVRKSAKLSVGAVTYSVDRANPIVKGFVKKFGNDGAGFDGPKWVECPVEQAERIRSWFTVTITGTVPRLAGWEFLATLQHLEVEGEAQNLLRIVPGFDGSIPAEFHKSSPERCDHCHKAIRSRKETFIVRNDAGEFKQVGRNCTQDFLGGKDPHEVAKLLQMIFDASSLCSEDEGFGGGGSSGKYVTSALALCAVVVGTIRLDGWLSRGKARDQNRLEQATANLAWGVIFPSPQEERSPKFQEYRAKVYAVEGAEAEAKAALEYIRENIDLETEQNEYRRSLRIACAQKYVDFRLAGIVASAVPFYQREMQTLKEREGLRRATGGFIGQPKERLTVDNAQVVFSRFLESEFGPRHMVKLVTGAGESITAFNCSVFGKDLSIGDIVRVRGTVVKHETHEKYGSTTVMNRVETYDAEFLAKAAEFEAAAKAEKKAAAAAKRAEKKAAKAAVAQP